MIKRHQCIGQQEQRIGQPVLCRIVSAIEFRLEETNRVIPQVAHESADEARQIGQRYRGESLELGLQDVQRIGAWLQSKLASLVVRLADHGVSMEGQQGVRLNSDKRIAAYLLAAL